jgi:hypothetical protein
VNRNRRSSAQPTFSRRELFGAAANLGAVAAIWPAAGPVLGRRAAVVSFHSDAPYLDLTGRAPPYLPRIATDWADGQSTEALIRLGHIF